MIINEKNKNIRISAFNDICLGISNWCKRCQSSQFKENFDNWTTGDKGIDEFIKETQLEATDCTEYLEWVPFNSFIGVSKYDKSEVGTVYTSLYCKLERGSKRLLG